MLNAPSTTVTGAKTSKHNRNWFDLGKTWHLHKREENFQYMYLKILESSIKKNILFANNARIINIQNVISSDILVRIMFYHYYMLDWNGVRMPNWHIKWHERVFCTSGFPLFIFFYTIQFSGHFEVWLISSTAAERTLETKEIAF